MENIDKHMITGTEQEQELFRRVRIPWEKSKEEAWQEIQTRISVQSHRQPLRRSTLRIFWPVAATLAVVLAGTLFMRFYTGRIITGPGEERSFIFPDGSTALMNGESELTWNPMWWKISRIIHLHGEAFFEVEKGRRFEVKSSQGTTTVLGTRFNVLARGGNYEVSCLSGKVRVVSGSTADAMILLPDEKVTLDSHGKLELIRAGGLENQIRWLQKEWTFTGEPLVEVIQTIEQLFHISITLPANDTHRFTGGFDQSMTPDQVLDLVCTPFGYTFTKKADGGYAIFPK